MTISAENDTEGAAKQMLTFLFIYLFFGEHPTLGGTEAERTRNEGDLQKNKKRLGPEFPTQSMLEPCTVTRS